MKRTRTEPMPVRKSFSSPPTASAMLQNHALSVTAGRVAVLSVLLVSTDPLPLRDILSRVSTAGVPVDRVTVYRTLRLLHREGLLYRVGDGTPGGRFGANRTDSSGGLVQVHFKCLHCGLLSGLPNVEPPVTRLPGGFEPYEQNLLITGRCATCHLD